MLPKHREAIGRVAALLLVLGSGFCPGAVQANEADDSLHQLAAQAREQAKAGDTKSLAETLSAIVKTLPEATADGVSAVSQLNGQLAELTASEQGQSAPPSPAPTEPGALPAAQSDPSPAKPDTAAAAPPSLPPEQTAQPAAAPPQADAASEPEPRIAATVPGAPVAPPPISPPQPDREAVAPPAVSAPQQPAPPPTADAALPVAPQPPQASSEDLTSLLRRRGDEFLATGDVAGARSFYQRGAEGGCGPCAAALAETYDAGHLHRMGVVGVPPDAAQADNWRARASRLEQAGTP